MTRLVALSNAGVLRRFRSEGLQGFAGGMGGLSIAGQDQSRAAAPRSATIFSATRQALAIMVSVGFAPVPIGKGELSTVADVGTAARLGDPFSAELLRRGGRLAAIREALYRHAPPVVTRDLVIQRSRRRMFRSAARRPG